MRDLTDEVERPPLPLVGRGWGRGPHPRTLWTVAPHPCSPGLTGGSRLPSPRKGERVWGFAAGLLCLLGACQTPSTDYVEFHSSQDPVATASRITENVGACWFGGERAAFAEYSYAPELTSYSNRPRVLIVPKKEPHGLPQLVIEATAAKRGTSVKLFGPLMATAEAPAIARDVERWSGGASGCAGA